MTARTSEGDISASGRQLRASPYPSANRSSINGVAGGGTYRYSATNRIDRTRKPAAQNAAKRPSRRNLGRRPAALVTSEPGGRSTPRGFGTGGRGPEPLCRRLSMPPEYPTSRPMPPRAGPGRLQLMAGPAKTLADLLPEEKRRGARRRAASQPQIRYRDRAGGGDAANRRGRPRQTRHSRRRAVRLWPLQGQGVARLCQLARRPP